MKTSISETGHNTQAPADNEEVVGDKSVWFDETIKTLIIISTAPV